MTYLKKLIIAGAFFMILASGDLFAQTKPFGLGIVVGEPTGISGKYWTGQTTALDGAVAWSFNHEGSFYIHADFLKHHFDIIDVSEGKMPLYYGIGGKMVLADKGILGAHVPLGIAYMFETAPLDIFLEIRPGLNLLPATEFDMSGGIGVRFYFD
ncbi:MAG TPA: hypothetical protein P5514_11060 [Bacteroidales bacterium]|nr:hypothetical protein [Bacteroidales bacterium]HPE56138.1 hypothetical protein [Bacteroidales bacterium]HRX97476.1 hypothetical protein [Bacteroidales bacterium]